MCENIHSLHFKTGLTPAFCFFYRGPCLCCSHPYLTHQLKKINELIGIFPCGQVQEVSWDSVGQTWAGLHSDFTGGGTECRSVLIKYKMCGVNTAAQLSKIQAVQYIWTGFEEKCVSFSRTTCSVVSSCVWLAVRFLPDISSSHVKSKESVTSPNGLKSINHTRPFRKTNVLICTCNYFHTC